MKQFGSLQDIIKNNVSKTSKAYMIEIDNDEDREQYNNMYKNLNIKTYSLISCDSEGNEKKLLFKNLKTVFITC